jgi:hypothetical protein
VTANAAARARQQAQASRPGRLLARLHSSESNAERPMRPRSTLLSGRRLLSSRCIAAGGAQGGSTWKEGGRLFPTSTLLLTRTFRCASVAERSLEQNVSWRVKNVPELLHVPASFCIQVHNGIFRSNAENADFYCVSVVLPDRIELSTSPLPRECSTTELRQQPEGPSFTRNAEPGLERVRSLPYGGGGRKRAGRPGGPTGDET